MRLTAGILTYNDEKYLDRCLETLTASEGLGELGVDWKIVVLDNGSKDIEYLLQTKKKYPAVDFLLENENHGFGKGHNIIMRRYPAPFHAVLNNDVLFATEYLSLLVDSLNGNPEFGSATGKLLWWDFGGGREQTTMIDSTGIGVTNGHRFFDRGQGQMDHGQYDEKGECFGASGAAAVYRRSALDEVSYGNGEYFDETMFMYKEDCDLAERLLAIGKPSLYVPTAVAWHNRTASTNLPRRKRPERERIGSAAHHGWIIAKHWQWFPWNVRFAILCREFFRWAFILLREPKIFMKAWMMLRERKDSILHRRRQTKHLVPYKNVSRFFS